MPTQLNGDRNIVFIRQPTINPDEIYAGRMEIYLFSIVRGAGFSKISTIFKFRHKFADSRNRLPDGERVLNINRETMRWNPLIACVPNV